MSQTILVTGGTGSFGKRFTKTFLEQCNPEEIIVYSRGELKQYEMQNSPDFKKYYEQKKLRFFIGDVRDLQMLKIAMEGVDVVIHAAALKQVPACEYNPFEAVKTNIIGGQNVIYASFQCGVKKVIALSTDKAAAPINFYGASKLCSDKLFIAANNYKGKRDIILSIVRYGNVMGSSGSVIPFFIKQKNTGILSITDKRMTRFNLMLQDGVDFVIRFLEIMWGGELFVPKIPSYRIIDIAKAIDSECELIFTGIRPGEKIHEEMITVNDAINSIEFEDYYVIVPSIKTWDTEKFRLESSDKPGKYCKYGFSYNSGKNENFLNSKELKRLIKHMEA